MCVVLSVTKSDRNRKVQRTFAGPKGPWCQPKAGLHASFINFSMVDLDSLIESLRIYFLGNGANWINAYSMRNIFMVQLPALTCRLRES